MSVFGGTIVGAVTGALAMTGLVGPHALVSDTGLLAVATIVTGLSGLGSAVLVALIQAKSARDLAQLKFRADREAQDPDDGDEKESP